MAVNVDELVLELVEHQAERALSVAWPDDHVVFSTGVVVQVLPFDDISRRDIAEIYGEMKEREPKPPLVLNPAKGKKEPNPFDPTYVQERNLHLAKYGKLIDAIIYAKFVQVVHIPDGFPDHTNEDWLDERALTMRITSTTERGQLFDWLKRKAGPTNSDYQGVMRVAGRKMGVPEVDADESTKSP